MTDRQHVTDVEFRLVDDRWRLSLKDVLWYVFWVGSYALAAYGANEPVLRVLLVLCAGMAWPVRRWLGSLSERVSPEQEAFMRERVSAGQPWRKRALKAPR